MTENTEKEPVSGPDFRINGLYIKDLSFENPGAPLIFLQPNIKPKISVGVDVFINNIKESAFDVSLKVSAKAVTEEGRGLFIAEVVYGGLFVLNPSISRDLWDKVLFVDCAQCIFPYVRRTITDLTTEGGFAPLLLEPIDLEAIYMAKQAKDKKAANG